MMNATLDKLIINMRRKKESSRPHGIADEGYTYGYMLSRSILLSSQTRYQSISTISASAYSEYRVRQ